MRWGSALVLGTLVGVGGCQGPPEAVKAEDPTVLIPPSESAPSGVVRSEPAPPVVAPTREGRALTMKPFGFVRGRMRLEIVDEPHEVVAWPKGGVLMQTVRLDPENVLRVVVRAGDGESLEGFVRDHQHAELSKVEKTTICGKPAERMVAQRSEQHITCIMYADGRPNSPGYLPAETTVAAAFEHRGLGVTAVWEVPTAMRAQYRELEERFFASFACE